MEIKKTEKASLENKRTLFLLIGLTLALIASLLAFEWSTNPTQKTLGTLNVVSVEEEVIPITRQEEVKPPPPPPQVIEFLNIVDNTIQVDNNLDIFNSEADSETFIDFTPIVITDTEKEQIEDTQLFFIVEEMPEFPGGDAALLSYIARTIKYPIVAQENGIQGRVYVSFIIDKNGKVSDAKLIRGVDISIDNEALRVINIMPTWKPGKQRGVPVRVSYTVPISFILQ